MSDPANFTRDTPLFAVLADPRGHAIVADALPDLVGSAVLHTLHGYPIGLIAQTEDGLGEAEKERLLADLAAIDLSADAPAAPAEEYVAPRSDYDDAPRGSAGWSASDAVAVYGRFELVLEGPSHGNPFIDVVLDVQIDGPGVSVSVPGFYDGGGVYRARYMPEASGAFRFMTVSNAASIDGISRSFEVGPAAPGSHGPVRVADQFHFAYADGTRYRPVGTTSYVWTHQGDELEEATLASLEASSFTKMRMCVFPKSYLFNENEPELFPYVGDLAGGFDFQRFSPEYWAHLEKRIDQLAALGIEADLILYHGYDRWGFATMDPVSDDRYLRYATARLASFANVWWSLANEYDLLFDKTEGDWERFAQIVTAGDPSGHLLSIHNCRDFYDHSREWVTHASIQRQDVYKTAEMTNEWREAWGKPVVIDECAYEGDIDQGWGNISGEEMTRRAWEGAVRGGYVGHGETYVDPEDVLWWAKGGTLHGSSPARLGFLDRIVGEAPGGVLEPIQIDWDVPRAGVEGEHLLYYFGFNQPTYRRFLTDPRISWEIDIIDTWNMTIETLPGTYSGRFRIDLPGRQFMAVRLRARA
jgi:hypothetical protein